MSSAHEEAAHARQPEASIYTDSDDRRRHRGIMQAIAEEMQRPFDEIAELYEEVLRQMRARARIPDFLPVLVSKKVKQICRRH